MSAETRVLTRRPLGAGESEAVIIKGDTVLAVLPEHHPFLPLVWAPRSSVRNELRIHRETIMRYLSIFPDERRTLTAILRYQVESRR